MKRLLAIASLMMMLMTSAEAQDITLGGRLPNINVHSAMGPELGLIEHEYVCLVFIHSESLPCVAALESFNALADSFSDTMAVVLLTPEQRSNEQDALARYVDSNTTVAFDNEHRTFKAFGVEYVPFGVVFDTKRRRVQWFGTIAQLTEATIRTITNK